MHAGTRQQSRARARRPPGSSRGHAHAGPREQPQPGEAPAPGSASGRTPVSNAPPSQVHYTFNKVLMLQEPLLVVATFYILFFTVIVYVRLDFSITKVPGRLRGALALRPSGQHTVAWTTTPTPTPPRLWPRRSLTLEPLLLLLSSWAVML